MDSSNISGGRRLKKVSAKTIRLTLRKAGINPKGRMVLKGGSPLSPAAVGGSAHGYGGSAHTSVGGRRRRGTRRGGTRRGRKSRRSMFGLRY